MTSTIKRMESHESSANDRAIMEAFAGKYDDVRPRHNANVLTFKAWKEKGRSVRKGEKGTRTVLMLPRKYDKNGKAEAFAPRTVYLFHESQTEPNEERERRKERERAGAGDGNKNRGTTPEELSKAALKYEAKIDVTIGKTNTRKRLEQAASKLCKADTNERIVEALRRIAHAELMGTLDPVIYPLDVDAIVRAVDADWDRVTYRRNGGLKYVLHDERSVAIRKLVNEKVTPWRSDDAWCDLEEGTAMLLGIPGFFPTPPDLAARMVEIAKMCNFHRVLEPSAGSGRILRAMMDWAGDRGVAISISAYEANHDLAKLATRRTGLVVDCNNFFDVVGEYHRIVMNPPFENGADIDHVMHAWNNLADDGRIVAIMSEGPFFRSDKKSAAFREHLEEWGWSEKLPDGTFKDSGTGVACRLVVLDK